VSNSSLNAGTFSNITGVGTLGSLTVSGLTATQLLYAGTGGLLNSSANMTFNGTTLTLANDASISGLTVGKGGGGATNNTAIGLNALPNTNTGTNNTAVGSTTMAVNTVTGAQNTTVGVISQRNLSSGASNSSLGYASLYTNTTGAQNTAIGDSALYNNTTASNNTAVGYQAGYSNTTGLQDVFIGRQAGYSSTGNSQTFVGDQAGYSVTSGSNNTFVGQYAGQAATTGGSNAFFGQGSGYQITTGGKNSILGSYNGNQGGLDIRTSSNYIVLSDGDGNPRGIFDGSGNFLVGTTSTGARGTNTISKSGGFVFEVQQTQNSAGASMFGMSYSASAPNNTSDYFIYARDTSNLRFIVYSNGNVINTNNSYGAISDVKLKENIVDATPKLDDLMKVKIRNYNLIGDKTKQIGVVAQELETVFAGLVEETPDKDDEGNDLGTVTKGVKYSVFVPMLIKAVQELKADNDSMRAALKAAGIAGF
jgi:hypothetical protein